jgi:hypothetical protein
MLTGELRNQIDGICNDFWSGALSNPLQVIEQITDLIFVKRLDEIQELAERRATTLGKPIERRIFPEGSACTWRELPEWPNEAARGEGYSLRQASTTPLGHRSRWTGHQGRANEFRGRIARDRSTASGGPRPISTTM